MPTHTERLAAIQYIGSVVDDLNIMLNEGAVASHVIDARLARYAEQGWSSDGEAQRQVNVLHNVLENDLGGLISFKIDGKWTITTREAAAQMGAI